VSQKNKSLKFVIPEKLSVIGSIPLSSTNALAARTARERKAELTNTFNTSRHASVFEGVPLGRHPGESIHKLMSAPIVDGTKVIGVVQISRKGHSASNAGPDFTQKDLRALNFTVSHPNAVPQAFPGRLMALNIRAALTCYENRHM